MKLRTERLTGEAARLEDGSTLAIIGAGPAGSFFALLAIQEASSRGMRVRPVLFDGKPFFREGPLGCNMCAGVISWNLVQEIEQLGLQIPAERVQRLIRSYMFHTREGSHTVLAPPGRGPVPVVFRGNGPRFSGQEKNISFDDFLLEQALVRGAELVRCNVERLSLPSSIRARPRVSWPEGELDAEVVVVACGVSSGFGRQLEAAGIGYRPPRCVRAYQAELELSEATLEKALGESIHVFSLGVPGIRFAAVIPKARYATVSLVGTRDMNHQDLLAFVDSLMLRRLLPPQWTLPERYCSCRPRLPVAGARGFCGNRLVIIGDASMSRYYKNGIDSAFRTARYAVRAIFDHGYSARVLRRSYVVAVRREFKRENLYARLLFRANDIVSTRRFWVRAHLHLVKTRPLGPVAQTLHFLTWNLFTGDAYYRDILRAGMSPRFLGGMVAGGLSSALQCRGNGRRDKSHSLSPAVLRVQPRPLGPLVNGSTVVIVGGGPGGTACGVALKKGAAERGIALRVVLFEGKVFDNERHFNQCAGVLSPPVEEMLKRNLGIAFPYDLVQRNIRSYRVCDADGELLLTSSTHRSYAVRRCLWDQFMMAQARAHAVEVVECRVTNLESARSGVIVYAENGTLRADVVVGAFGMDPGTAALFQEWISYRRPKALETIVTKIHPPMEWMDRFDEEIVVFLPRLARVSFGAITPKRNHLTVNIAGSRVSAADMEAFLNLPEVAKWLPHTYDPREVSENCYKGLFPNHPAKVFYADRFVAVGDAAGMVRPFKGKGVTSACMTGIAAAKVMMDYGISEKAFLAYRRACQPILADHYYGWMMQRLADLFRRSGTMPVLRELAARDADLRRALFLSVSGEESFRRIFRDSFRLSRAGMILAGMLRRWLVG